MPRNEDEATRPFTVRPYTISELIQILSNTKEKEGDLEVWASISYDVPDNTMYAHSPICYEPYVQKRHECDPFWGKDNPKVIVLNCR